MPESSRNERKELFKQVALVQLQTRKAGVLKGSVEGAIVCPDFLEDVALITEEILKASHSFGNYVAKDAVDVEQIVEEHKQHVASLTVKTREVL